MDEYYIRVILTNGNLETHDGITFFDSIDRQVLKLHKADSGVTLIYNFNSVRSWSWQKQT